MKIKKFESHWYNDRTYEIKKDPLIEKYKNIIKEVNSGRADILDNIYKIHKEKFISVSLVNIYTNEFDISGGIVQALYYEDEKIQVGVTDEHFNEEYYKLEDIDAISLMTLYVFLYEMKILDVFHDYLMIGEDAILEFWRKYKNEIDLNKPITINVNKNVSFFSEDLPLILSEDYEFQDWFLDKYPEKVKWIMEQQAEFDERIKEKYGHLIDGVRFNL